MTKLSAACLTAGLLITSFLTSKPAHADFVTCSQYLTKDRKMSRAVDYLRTIAGHYQLGTCAIELHVCEADALDDLPGSIVGDLMITDRDGQQSYLQIDFPRYQTDQTTTAILNGRLMLHYEFDDWHRDAVFGRHESTRLEFVKSPDQKSLIRLELGSYSTKDWQSRKRGSVYRWIICNGNHPLSDEEKGLIP